ncbi:MAG TPA: DinB family protein [Chitinophagaceae bacterium]|nr:DinB family protein [Chitinophagaceae bacterium]
MNKEILAIINEMETVLDGEPWFGRAVYEILQEVDASKAFVKPGPDAHSMVELLYHMITWAEFTLKRIEKDQSFDLEASEKLDWRQIDPQIHGWEEGLSQYIAIHQQILAHLKEKEDAFLNEKVDFRNYDYRFLLKGLVQHNIYHLGQIAYVKKLL